MPPSVKELRRRLNKRGTEAEDVIEKRVAQASEEIRQADKYDYIMVNGELEKAIDDLKAIITAEKMTSKRDKYLINEVLENA